MNYHHKKIKIPSDPVEPDRPKMPNDWPLLALFIGVITMAIMFLFHFLDNIE